MKNACIVLRKVINVSNVGDVFAVTDAFFKNGYALDELRFLPQSEEARIKTALTELKGKAENIILLADKTALPIAARYLSETFGEDAFSGGYGGAGIYADKKNTLFLLSADQTDTGLEYAKKACFPYLQKKYGIRYDRLVVRTVGANEARVKGLLEEARNLSGEKASCHHRRQNDEDVIELVYDGNTPKMLIDDVLRLLVDGLGDTVYALEDTPLEEQLVTLLKVRRRKISVAESFTGGGIAKRITSVSGAGEVYFEGLNTYDEQAKAQRLGVSEYTLKTFGAVSDQTAYEMALGLLNTGNCDIAIATTGLAGPNTDKSGLPIGLCYIAVGVKERVFVYRYKFDGTREEITDKAINYALFLAYKQLKNL